MDIMFLLFAALLVFAAASWAWGVDSRDGSSDRRRLIYPAVTRG
jgi:hypothetical protein